MKVKISFIIPSYNMGDYIGGAVRSLVNPIFDDRIEVIVLDDGSTDNTWKVVRQFTNEKSKSYDPRVDYYRHENKGKSSTVNRGFKISRGEYITILDADDYVSTSGLSARMRAVHSRNDNSELVVGRCEVFGESGALDLWELPKNREPEVLRKQFLYGVNQPFHLNASMWSSELLRRVGGFNESNPRCHDIDYAARLLEHADSIEFLEQTVYCHRKYRSSHRERLRIRFVTIQDRIRVVSQNLSGIEWMLATVTGATVDFAKLLFEFFSGAYPSRNSLLLKIRNFLR